MRARNQREVFQEVHRRGPISRAAIAASLHLSPATVTNITGELIGRGLLFEAREAAGGGVGRRAILLEVDYARARVAGVKVSPSSITCAVTNLNAEVSATATTPLLDPRPAAVVEGIAGLLHDLGALDVAALGVDLPGAVGADGATVRFSPLLGWRGVGIGALLEERLGVPVTVENDVNALALAEAWFGYGRGHDDFLTVTLGRGVGLGIVIGGEIYRGPRGGAGEFGHVVLNPRGPEVAHAGPGTVEAYLSDDALLRSARSAGVEGRAARSIEELTAAAQRGEELPASVFSAAGEVLGRALSILVNVFAPSLVVISGEGMRAADLLLPTARRILADASFGDLGREVEIVVDTWGDDAWARGAAGLAARRYLLEAATWTGGEELT